MKTRASAPSASPSEAPAASEPSCPICRGSGVHGSPGVRCEFCRIARLGREFQATQEAPADERAAFEAFAIDSRWAYRDTTGRLQFHRGHSEAVGWLAWQARAALSTAAAPAQEIAKPENPEERRDFNVWAISPLNYVEAKRKVAPLPPPLCRDDTQHDVDYYTADQVREYGRQCAQAERERSVQMANERIREVFLSHGFTIKEGHTDLKPYVYAAARALLHAAAEQGEQG